MSIPSDLSKKKGQAAFPEGCLLSFQKISLSLFLSFDIGILMRTGGQKQLYNI